MDYAVIIPERFNDILFPLNDKENDILLPFATIPYIEHIIEVVFSAGIKKIILILKNYGNAVKDYISIHHKNIENKFTFLINEDLNSVGDCLRYLNSQEIIHSDFLLIRGITITNFNLEKAINEHKNNKDKSILCTSIFKTFKNTFNNHTKYDENILIYDGITKKILQYDFFLKSKKVKFNPNLKFFKSQNKQYIVKVNAYETFIDICSKRVLDHFKEYYKFSDLRDMYVKFVCDFDEIYEDSFYYYEIGENFYSNQVKNLDSYLKINQEIISRWVHPMMILDNLSISPKLEIQYVYSSEDVYLGVGKENISFTSQINLSRLSSVLEFRSSYTRCIEGCVLVNIGYTTKLNRAVVGSHTIIGEGCTIINSIIGKRCKISDGCKIFNSIILDDVEIKDKVEIHDSIICNNTTIPIIENFIENTIIGTRVNLSNEFINENNLDQNFIDLRIYKTKKNFLRESDYNNRENIVDSDSEEDVDDIIVSTHNQFFEKLNNKNNEIFRVLQCKEKNDDKCVDDCFSDSQESANKSDYHSDNEESEVDEFTEYKNLILDIFSKKSEIINKIEEIFSLTKSYFKIISNSESKIL